MMLIIRIEKGKKKLIRLPLIHSNLPFQEALSRRLPSSFIPSYSNNLLASPTKEVVL